MEKFKNSNVGKRLNTKHVYWCKNKNCITMNIIDLLVIDILLE